MNKIEVEKFISIYKEYYKKLVHYAFFRVSDFNLAEEFVQETFLKTWVYANAQESEITDYKNFLYRVLKNLIIDFYKQNHKNEIPIDLANQKLLPKVDRVEEHIDNKMKFKFIIKSINSLEKKYKKILIYRFLEELSIDKISSKTGLSPNHISVITYQGLGMIKKQAKKFALL